MIGSLKKLFDINEREIKKALKIVEKINRLDSDMQQLSDTELKNKTVEFKKRYHDGETLDDLLVESFAVVKEASSRVLGMKHYDVQLIGGYVLHHGKIAEMKTGEGKTLVSTLPSYLNALSGNGVHIITVNEYLAERDKEEMGKVHEFLGLNVGLNIRDLTKEEKQKAYSCDITYGTNNEFAFDYLRDNMVAYQDQRVQRKLHYCIIDEVDSILIDEARTPLIVSGAGDTSTMLYKTANSFARTLQKDKDFTYDLKTKSVQLTEDGINKAEKSFSIDNLFDLTNVQINHHINQALKAHVSMEKDVDYVVQDGEVVIVDQFTGRLTPGRRYSEGLHQAIEAKEGVEIKKESKTLATVTFQNFFRMYEKLSGMTGTAKTEEEEFRNIYGMNVVVIPTNKPILRKDKTDLIFMNKNAKFKAVIEEIKNRHQTGQPILVGTSSIEISEELSIALRKKGIKHEVLNAKHHEKEAEIVKSAGEKYSVTIATNMAGRGTDIKIDDEVKSLGGLFIIGTERHESRRIDNQLRGRSGRQGDPGGSQFYLSMEDDLMKRFGSEKSKGYLKKAGFEEDEPIESKWIAKAIENAQKQVEGNNFDSRKQLLNYDNVLNEQREIIYQQRNEVIESENINDIVITMMKSSILRFINNHHSQYDDEATQNLDGLVKKINQNFLQNSPISSDDLTGKDDEELLEFVIQKVLENYHNKKEQIDEESFHELEKLIMLNIVDNSWTTHIDEMSRLREGIHLRAYGQNDPFREYQSEGFVMFENMIESIEDNVTFYLLNAEMKKDAKREQFIKDSEMVTNEGSSDVKKKPYVKKDKVGRNAPCPCGSGKKYKNCHGK